nr:PREDICTED: EPIDERMAL PATTERNING FACTOR-like protein 1 [Musa acuminata subsp. malaccensis]
MRRLSHALFLATSLMLALLVLLPASCAVRSLLSSPEGMLMEEKIRLGSTPPSCHNRCNQCDPCTAVEIPTLPARSDRVRATDHPSSYSNHYSDYKPLGWRCRCGSRLYNP